MNRPLSQTVMEALIHSLRDAAAHNPTDAEKPVAILWTDRDSQWLPIVPCVRELVPELLVFGEYQPEHRTGPAIWLRCAVDRTLGQPEIPREVTPIVYLSGVSRQDLTAAGGCPDHLKPLVELQYRGGYWTQKNGRDWTVEAFLVSEKGGLGLDVKRDAVTRQSMLRSLTELATASLEQLRSRRLEAEDFDRLLSDDPVRDVLAWLSDPGGVWPRWDEGRRRAFESRCKADLGFDPQRDGEFVAAERLGRRKGPWGPMWRRFAESPALYPGIPERLRRAMPSELFIERSSWPQTNEQDEAELRRALMDLPNSTPLEARQRVMELEKAHGPRREWVWAKFGHASLAVALEHLAALADRTGNQLGGDSTANMVKLYAEDAWKVDAAALLSAAAVKSDEDGKVIGEALNVIYLPWLESAARHLQRLVEMAPLPGRDEQDLDDIYVASGGLILFVDGLRFDVSQRLVDRLHARGRSVAVSTRWAGLPTVTATAKPAVSPVAPQVEGVSVAEDFLPTTADTKQPLTVDRFRRLLDVAGYQFLLADETGDPSGRGWTENGRLDKLGHSLGSGLASAIPEQIESLLERIESLFDAGWREVRVVTDHGWLWLPGGLPKVDLPKYLTRSRWARCASIKGEPTVETPTVRWHWNSHERVAIAPGIACFGAGHEYAHGGVSLQESLVPVIRIGAGSDVIGTTTAVTAVSWVGLRCRVRLDPPQSGLSVDLRLRVSEADSSVSAHKAARLADDEGTVSLLVADDGLKGTPAAVVVVDAGGHIIAKQPTIIGGDG